jgi:hypothetical protein
MAGKRAVQGADFVTGLAFFREAIAVDSTADFLDDELVPVLNTYTHGAGQINDTTNDIAQYGRNAQLDLSVIVGDGVTSVTLELWKKAEIERTPIITNPVTPAPTLASRANRGTWVRVTTKVLTFSELWVIKDIPPSYYKVYVSAFSGTGLVSILEQHAS